MSERGAETKPTRPLTWLSTAVASLFGLMMLYIPYQFQSPPYQVVYEHLRPLGAMFTLSALGIAASSFDLGMPRWAGSVSRLVLIAGLVELNAVVAIPHGMWMRALALTALIVAIALSMVRPAWEEKLLAGLLVLLATCAGTIILNWPHLLSNVMAFTPATRLAWLFLIAGVALCVSFVIRNRWKLSTAVAMFFASFPFLWFAAKWVAISNWTGAGLYAVLGLAAALRGLYLARPWTFKLPKLRQRVIALTLLLTVIPLLTVGALAVYDVQKVEQQRALTALTAAVLQFEQSLNLDAPKTTPAWTPIFQDQVSYDRVNAQVLSGSEVPTHWPNISHVAEKLVSPDGYRQMVAFIRRPDLGVTVAVTMEVEDAFREAFRLSAIILLTTLAVFAGAMAAALVLSRRVTRHLSEVQSAARSLSDLQFHPRLAAPNDDDEVAELAHAFNRMAGTLETYTEEIQAQNEELQAQTEELQAQQEELQTQQEELLAQNEELLAKRDELESQSEQLQATEKALRLSQALLADQREVLVQIATGAPLHLTLDTLVRFLEERVGYGACGIFIFDESETELRLAAGSSLPERYRNSLQQFPPEPGTEARRLVFATTSPIFSPSLAEDPLWHVTAPIATECGLAACWSVPILDANKDPIGVVALFLSHVREPGEREAELAEITARIAAIAIDRRRMEEGQVQKLYSVIRHMSEGVLAITSDATLLFANQAAIRLLGLTERPEQLTLEAARTPTLLAHALQRVNEPGNYAPERIMFNLENVKVEAHVSPVYTDLSRYGAVAVVRNVTEEEQFRRLQESFVANVSHELRGPLASVSATLEAFADGVIPEDNRPKYLHAMLTEMERLRRLSYDVVDLTRLDSGLVNLDQKRFSLDQLFRELEAKSVQHCAGVGLRLIVGQPGLTVYADYDRVGQVLVNLLDNAVRFTPEGGEIRLDARIEGDLVRMFVADTGIGIPQEHLPYIWERFYKVDQARTLVPGSGTGLGLSIVRQLVEQMGGEVLAESEPGRGTTFSFTLPAG